MIRLINLCSALVEVLTLSHVHTIMTERVKLTGFSVQSEGGDTQPACIKVFVNTTTLDFSDCESLPADVEMVSAG